jgi:hypothetical protein
MSIMRSALLPGRSAAYGVDNPIINTIATGDFGGKLSVPV